MMNIAAPLGEQSCGSRGSAPCRDMASELLDDFTENLIHLATQSASGLSIDEIKDFLTSYKKDHIVDHDFFIRSHYQNCLNRCQQEVFEPTTMREPFKRVITSRFVGLFPPVGGLDEDNKYLSRRMLPGFFSALEKMVGGDAMNDGHDLCIKLIENMRHTEQGFLWEDLYDDAEAQGAVDELLMAWVPHFTDPVKRVAWLRDVINNGLAPAGNYQFEGQNNGCWQISEIGVVNLLCTLFSNLKQRLSDPHQVKAMTDQYGAAKVRALFDLVNGLKPIAA